MRKTSFSMVAAIAAFAGTVSIAKPLSLILSDAFGGPATQMTLQDLHLDATARFKAMDIDRNDLLDAEEYASQALVYAELARFTRVVTIEGADLVHISLPQEVAPRLTSKDRLAIETAARRDYAYYAEKGAPLSHEDWIVAQTNKFRNADANQDGKLSGHELQGYALYVAKHRSTMG
ncbi:MAG: hypothetical protein AAF603_03635 [Pseudomonadota bacterium]